MCSLFFRNFRWIYSFPSQFPPFLSWQFLSPFCFSFRLKSPSLSACWCWRFLQYSSPFGISCTNPFSHQSTSCSSVFLFKTKSIPGYSRGHETNHWQQRQNYLYLLIQQRGQWTEGLIFIFSLLIFWTNKPISLKASLTDGAAVDQKASLTFQSATAQIRQQQPFWDGCHLSDVLGGQ